MKKPKALFILVLVLLIINTVFFVLWYAIDLQDVIRAYLERELSASLSSKVSIGNLSLSNTQVIVSDFRLGMNDGSLDLKFKQLRVKYDLLQLVLPPYNMSKVITEIRLFDPFVTYNYSPGKSKEPSKEFEIPDLSSWFEDITISNGSFRFNGKFPLALPGIDTLNVSQQINGVTIKIINPKADSQFQKQTVKSGSTFISLSGFFPGGGQLSASSVLRDGVFLSLQSELSTFKPSGISCPLFEELTTEISASFRAYQTLKNAPWIFDLNTIAWDTRIATAQHKLAASFLNLKANHEDAELTVSGLDYNSCVLDLNAAIKGYPNFRTARISGVAELRSILPGVFYDKLDGSVSGVVTVSGTVSEPVVDYSLSSNTISYKAKENMPAQVLNDLRIKGGFKDKTVSFGFENARWKNQFISASGSYDLGQDNLTGQVTTNAIEQFGQDLVVDGSLEFDVIFGNGYPDAIVYLNDLSVYYRLYDTGLMNGLIRLVPMQETGKDHYLADINLISDKGLNLEIVGDLLERTITADIRMDGIRVADVYANEELQNLDPLLSGSMFVLMQDDNITSEAAMQIRSNQLFDLGFETVFSYDLESESGFASVKSIDSTFRSQKVDFNFFAQAQDGIIDLKRLQLNDFLDVTAKYNIKEGKDLSFDAWISGLNTSYVMKYLEELDIFLPSFDDLSMRVKYNLDGKQSVFAHSSVMGLEMPSVKPLNLELKVEGDASAMKISGYVENQFRERIPFNGSSSIQPKVDLDLTVDFDRTSLYSYIFLEDIECIVDGSVRVLFSDVFASGRDLNLFADLSSSNIITPELTVDNVRINLAQLGKELKIDTLDVYIKDCLSLTANGSIDYNLFTQTFFDGDKEISISMDTKLFEFLASRFEIIEQASGKANLKFKIKSFEDQFLISDGLLSIKDGQIRIPKQMEPITNIQVTGKFENNKLMLSDTSMRMGDGKITILNTFEDDPSDHFFIGFLDLGSFLVRTTDSGIPVTIPSFTTANTTTTVGLKGRNSRYAVVRGPFDDMEIIGDLFVADALVTYPPKTENLLSLIYSVRDVARPKAKSDTVPLPFTLDLLVDLRSNLRYVTYPLNIEVQPSSYIHILYDGNKWKVKDALFTTERGSIDFFGVLFQVDFVSFNMVAAQSVMRVDGSFINRAADGTLIRLNVRTDNDLSKDFLSRISFELTSDNPDDKTSTQILSRLRYNRALDDLSASERQTLLQDEALSFVSQNLNTTLLTPILYPLQNRIRRFLHLDGFNIKVGFIQNLFTEYTSDSEQFSDYADLKQFNNDIVQFSSSILLNNLSIGMSKYLGRQLYLDYNFTLQEATDIQNRTKLLVRHDTALRAMLPWRLRIAYTFTYEPVDEALIHEVLLQRSFRF